MYADVVGTPGSEYRIYQCVSCKTFQNAKLGIGGFTVFTNCHHKWWCEEVCRRDGKVPDATDWSMRTRVGDPVQKFTGHSQKSIR